MKKTFEYMWILTVLLFTATAAAYSQQIYTPEFQIETSGITPNCQTANFSVEHPEVCNEEFVCAGRITVENTDFIQTFLPYRHGVSPMHISFKTSYDGSGYPRFLLMLNSIIYWAIDFQTDSEGHCVIALDEVLTGEYANYLGYTHQMQFMFFVVDEEHKNTVVTSPTQVFVPNEQILVPMNGTFSFSMEVTYEKTGYVPDLEPIDPGPVSSDQSYIRTRTMTAATGTSYVDKYAYYDGLGRPIQTVQQGITPLENDLVTLRQYDGFGRESRTWLPAVVAGNGGAYVPLVRIMSEAKENYGDRKAYSYPIYESSPLDRVTELYGPGEKWQIADRAERIRYLTNDGTDSLECLRFSASDYGPTDTVVVVSGTGQYIPGEMYVSRTEDEDGNAAFEFRDKRNLVVLVRQVVPTGIGREFHDTYYLYDTAGNLRAVLPPMASASMQDGGPWSSDTSEVLRRYAYLYRYDGRNRCVAKRLPGADWIRIIYDRTDTPVFTQDGELRLQGEWAFSIPDAFGRTTLSGVCSSAPDPASLATETVRAVPAYKEAGMLAGYRVEGVTLSSPHHVTAYYYDDYGFLALPEFSGKGLEYTVSEVDGCFLTRYGSDAEAYKHTGLLTGGRTAIFSADPDMDSCLYAATYYDDRKRPVQIRCSGYHGLDHEYLAYTFTGQRSISRHVYPGDWTVTSVNGYDHAERLRMTTVGVNGPSGSHADTRIRYDYDELGRLSSRTYETGDSPLRTDYTHNIRGWLTGQQDDGFRMALAYESPQYVAPSYTGNIAEWTWRHAGGEENTYAFAYDGLSRLTDTRQYQAGERTDRFVERSLTYDRNGNILTLQRSQGDAVTTDFAYTYAGNRLVSLSDSGTAYPYAYDTNGNLVHDGANGLDMTYNRLNLIEKVTRDGRLLANFSYLSNGRKYLMSSDDGHGLCYVGSLVYERPSSGQSLELESVEFDGGRFIKTSGGLEARYFVTDHLGSVRAVRTSSGEVVEQNDYYPFGLRWADSGSSVSDNRYRYNGKEDLSFLKIPYTDFGFRQFDPKFRLGWNGADPLAEKYFPVSPYAFCAGNPVNLIDLEGQDIWEINSYGNIVRHLKTTRSDAFFMVDEYGNRMIGDNYSIEFPYKTVVQQNSYTYLDDEKGINSYDVYRVRGDKNGTALFEFLADNITGSPTKVEIGQIMTGLEGDKGLNFITTSHTERREAGLMKLIRGQIGYGYTIREVNHSHPIKNFPSGLAGSDEQGNGGDMEAIKLLTNSMISCGAKVASFHIYHVPTKRKIPYSVKSRAADFEKYTN